MGDWPPPETDTRQSLKPPPVMPVRASIRVSTRVRPWRLLVASVSGFRHFLGRCRSNGSAASASLPQQARQGAASRPRSMTALEDWTSRGSPASWSRRACRPGRAQTCSARTAGKIGVSPSPSTLSNRGRTRSWRAAGKRARTSSDLLSWRDEFPLNLSARRTDTRIASRSLDRVTRAGLRERSTPVLSGVGMRSKAARKGFGLPRARWRLGALSGGQ